MKKSVLLGVTMAAMALPNIAMAHCGGHKNGSFNVSCESGVKVYRHDALQSPRIDPNISAQIKIANINRRTQLDAINSRERIANRRAQLERRRVASEEFFQRSLVERPSNLSRLGFNNGFNNFGFNGRNINSRFGSFAQRRGRGPRD